MAQKKPITKVMLGDKLLHPTDYVAAIELKGRDVSLTIARVEHEDLALEGGKKERKPVLSFNGTKKKLVLNKTNAGTIADLWGQRAEDWVGKRITIYPTTTKFGKMTMDCIRVRPVRPDGSAPPPRAVEPEPDPPEEPPPEPTEPDAFADEAMALMNDQTKKPPAK